MSSNLPPGAGSALAQQVAEAAAHEQLCEEIEGILKNHSIRPANGGYSGVVLSPDTYEGLVGSLANFIDQRVKIEINAAVQEEAYLDSLEAEHPFNRGRVAFKHGVPKDNNPYTECDEPDWADWRAGWEDANTEWVASQD